MRDVFVVGAVRTPTGKRNGALAGVHPARLLGGAQRGLLESAGVDPAEVGQVLSGAVAQVGEQAFNIARTAWLAEGLPPETAATTVDAQCGSSQQAFTLGVGMVGSGLLDSALVCGVESMTRIPIGSNFRKQDGLGRPVPRAYKDHYEFLDQYRAAERIASMYAVERGAADEYGIRSQERAIQAWEAGRFDSQLIGVAATEEGAPVALERDEGLRAPDRAKIESLEPVVPDGVHTAATASQIADGASAVLLMTGDRAERLELRPLARVVDSVLVGVDPVTMLLGPHVAVPRLLDRNGLTADQIDLYEVNEAFAAIVLSFVSELKVDPETVNPLGGAIAMGHPLGATGTLLLTKAAHELTRRGSGRAVVTMCCGGGLGTATLLEAV